MAGGDSEGAGAVPRPARGPILSVMETADRGARDPTAPDAVHTGGCLCGAVRYRIRGELRDVIACHCSQCRRTSGHHAAMTSVGSWQLEIIGAGAPGLVWYRSSASAERGFCQRCGSNLFWKPTGGTSIAITAGTLDGPTHLRISEHIFVADKADYYELCDGKPQKPAW